MAKHANKNPATHGSQGGPSNNKTGRLTRKKTGPVVTRDPTFRSKTTDSTGRTSTTRSRKQVNASQTLTTSTRKRKSSESTAQRAGKCQRTRPLTTEDITTIVRAVRDALPEPNGTPQGSHDLEDTQDTEGTVSNVSDEFGMYSCLTTVCACISDEFGMYSCLTTVCTCIFVHSSQSLSPTVC